MKSYLIIAAAFLLSVGAVQAANTNFSHEHPEGTENQFQVGHSISICSNENNPSAQATITRPDATTFQVDADSMGCYAYLPDAEGYWTTAWTVGGSPRTFTFYAWNGADADQGVQVGIPLALFALLVVVGEWKKDQIYRTLAAALGIYLAAQSSLPAGGRFAFIATSLYLVLTWVWQHEIRPSGKETE